MLTRPLKVAHIVLSLDVGGLERNVLNQIRQRAHTSEDVSVICLEKPGTLAETAESLGATVVCANKQPGFRPQIALTLRKLIKQLHPDIVHTHQIGPLFYTRLATVGLNIPVVHTEHGREPYGFSAKLRALSNFAAKRAQIFYCLTEDMKQHVLTHNITTPNKIKVIHNGIDFANYTTPHDTRTIRDQLNIPHNAPLIGTIGRLTEIKRQDTLLEAFALVHDTIPTAHLLLIGDGPLRNDLEQLATRLDIANQVHFAGYQSNTAPYMQALDLFTLTSRSEGMPQSLLEAASANIPIIATNVGGIPEVIQHDQTGLLVEPANPQALGQAILDLIINTDKARNLATNAKNYVLKTFDIRRMAQEYHDDFAKLIQTPPSPCTQGEGRGEGLPLQTQPSR